MLNEKVRQMNFLYDTKSSDCRDQHMRPNAWEGIGKELKIKRKFYVSSRDVRIVCPRLNVSVCKTDCLEINSILLPIQLLMTEGLLYFEALTFELLILYGCLMLNQAQH